MGVVAAVVLVGVVVAAVWAVVREVRADGRRRRPVRDVDDWGDRRTPSCPYSRARW